MLLPDVCAGGRTERERMAGLGLENGLKFVCLFVFLLLSILVILDGCGSGRAHR